MKTLIAMLMLAVTLLTGCPAKTLETAKTRSAQLAGFANQGVNATRELFRERMLSLDQKDKIANAFIVLAKAGQTFDATVRNLENTYGDKTPRAEIDKLFEVFNSLVVGKFLDVLRELKLITPDSRIGEAVGLLREAVLIIAKAFGRQFEIRQQLTAV